MSYYAAEHLARQHHDQLAREASGDNLVRRATSEGPVPSRRVISLLQRLPGVLLTGIRRRMHLRHAANASPMSGPAARPRTV